jgi:hypothetical protein
MYCFPVDTRSVVAATCPPKSRSRANCQCARPAHRSIPPWRRSWRGRDGAKLSWIAKAQACRITIAKRSGIEKGRPSKAHTGSAASGKSSLSRFAMQYGRRPPQIVRPYDPLDRAHEDIANLRRRPAVAKMWEPCVSRQRRSRMAMAPPKVLEVSTSPRTSVMNSRPDACANGSDSRARMRAF